MQAYDPARCGHQGIGDYCPDGEWQHTAVVMVKRPTGLANDYDAASETGVDGVIVGKADPISFSGFAQDNDPYQWIIKKVHGSTQRAGEREI